MHFVFLALATFCVFFMTMSIRICATIFATCQLLQDLFQDPGQANILFDHTELQSHTPPSIALQGLRHHFPHLDHEFNVLDYESLRALDSNNFHLSVPPKSEEEINALPAHKFNFQAHRVSASGSQGDK